MTDSIRLSKRVIELTGCSRREAELYIQGGWVTVDGEVIDQPQHAVSDARVELLPGATPAPLEPVTLLLDLPSGEGTGSDSQRQWLRPESRWADDPAQQRILRGHFARLETRLPLQQGAGGLVVFSQDWRTLRKLAADASKLEQEYVVEVRGEISPGGLERLKRGQTYRGRALPACKVSWQNETHLRFALKHPALDFIEVSCASVGLHVAGIRRIRIGGVSMGKLPVGQWRYLGQNERF